jgi:hypothetical protein
MREKAISRTQTVRLTDAAEADLYALDCIGLRWGVSGYYSLEAVHGLFMDLPVPANGYPARANP